MAGAHAQMQVLRCPCGNTFPRPPRKKCGGVALVEVNGVPCPACGLGLPLHPATYHLGVARLLAELRTEADWIDAIAAELADHVDGAPSDRAREALTGVVCEATGAAERLQFCTRPMRTIGSAELTTPAVSSVHQKGTAPMSEPVEGFEATDPAYAERVRYRVRETVAQLTRESQSLLRLAASLHDSTTGTAPGAPVEALLQMAIVVQSTAQRVSAALWSVLSEAERLGTLLELEHAVAQDRLALDARA